MCFVDADTKVVFIDDKYRFNIFDVASGRLVKRVRLNSYIGAGCKSLDGSMLCLCFDWKKTIEIFDTKTWKSRGRIKQTIEAWCMRISPDASVLAVGNVNGVNLWSLPDGKLLWELPDLKGCLNNLAFSPDGCVLCVGSGNRIHMLMLRYELIPEV